MNTSTTTIVFVRHAEMVGNVLSKDDSAMHQSSNHRFRITQKGIKQAQFTRNYLLNHFSKGFDIGFVSTFYRSYATYEQFEIGYYFPQPIIDSRLDEKHDGIFHSLTDAEIDRHYPLGRETRKKEGWYHFRAPGGRNGPDVELSIHSFLRDIRELPQGHNCLVICHGNWLVLLDRILLNMTADQANAYRESTKTPNCSVTIFEQEGNQLKRVIDRFVPWEGKIEATAGENFG